MNIQEQIISKYRLAYPKDKLRDISKRTGINLTRIYRIMNGKLMKVSELEKFDEIINQKFNENPETKHFYKLIDKTVSLHSANDLKKIIHWLERKNATRAYQNYLNITDENEKSA